MLKSGAPITMLPLDVTHKILTSPERIAKLRNLGNRAGKTVADILDAYVQYDIKYYGLKGGPVHDATVVACSSPRCSGQADQRAGRQPRGITFGQTVADWYGLKQPANVEWINEGDAQGFFDLLTERIARLP